MVEKKLSPEELIDKFFGEIENQLIENQLKQAQLIAAAPDHRSELKKRLNPEYARILEDENDERKEQLRTELEILLSSGKYTTILQNILNQKGNIKKKLQEGFPFREPAEGYHIVIAKLPKDGGRRSINLHINIENTIEDKGNNKTVKPGLRAFKVNHNSTIDDKFTIFADMEVGYDEKKFSPDAHEDQISEVVSVDNELQRINDFCERYPDCKLTTQVYPGAHFNKKPPLPRLILKSDTTLTDHEKAEILAESNTSNPVPAVFITRENSQEYHIYYYEKDDNRIDIISVEQEIPKDETLFRQITQAYPSEGNSKIIQSENEELVETICKKIGRTDLVEPRRYITLFAPWASFGSYDGNYRKQSDQHRLAKNTQEETNLKADTWVITCMLHDSDIYIGDLWKNFLTFGTDSFKYTSMTDFGFPAEGKTQDEKLSYMIYWLTNNVPSNRDHSSLYDSLLETTSTLPPPGSCNREAQTESPKSKNPDEFLKLYLKELSPEARSGVRDHLIHLHAPQKFIDLATSPREKFVTWSAKISGGLGVSTLASAGILVLVKGLTAGFTLAVIATTATIATAGVAAGLLLIAAAIGIGIYLSKQKGQSHAPSKPSTKPTNSRSSSSHSISSRGLYRLPSLSQNTILPDSDDDIDFKHALTNPKL